MRPCVFSGEFIVTETETSDRSYCRVRVFLDYWNYELRLLKKDVQILEKNFSRG